MCIIVYKPKYKPLPSEETLKECFTNNRDGAGFSYSTPNGVVIKKGFMNFDEFYKELIKDYKEHKLKKHNLLLHFRIGTSGGINKEKTHPFPLTESAETINKTRLTGLDYSIVHNGILHDYTYKQDLSDTQNFIIDFLSPFLKLVKYDFNNAIVNKIINDEINTDKLAILSKNDYVYLYGNFIKDNGIYYSNGTYKKYTYAHNYYNFKDWEYWDDWNDYKSNYKQLTTKDIETIDDKDEKEIDYIKKNYNELIDGTYIELIGGDVFEVCSGDGLSYYESHDGKVYEIDEYCKTASYIGTLAEIYSD